MSTKPHRVSVQSVATPSVAQEAAATLGPRLLLSAATSERALRFGATTLQLGLLLVVLHVFEIEGGSGLLEITWLIFAGFLLHAALPLHYRPPFFLLLSFAVFWVLLGVQSLVLIALGLLLIGVCHLPVALRWRVLLLVAIGAGLAILRGAWTIWGQGAWASRVLPILGSMFMFRLIIYMYDLRHEKGTVSVWRRLSYFFLPLNACFLLFPIVDYQTFQRSDHNADTLDTYQKGVLWIFRGITHILLYRVVYYYLTPSPYTIGMSGVGDVMLYLITAWLFYLHVSGVFHMVIGMLCLFGFNLPPTQYLYFLASSPNDIWRRANIYWKDFMMKVFYYPAYKPLQKRMGITPALVTATLGVFLATWLLHSYQWFWVLGWFPFAGIDAGFWTVFAVLVLGNSLLELKRRRRPSASARHGWSFGAALLHSGKVLTMFLFMSIIWSWWSTRNTNEWVSMLAAAKHSSTLDFALLAVVIGIVLGAGVLVQYVASRGWRFGLAPAVSWRRSMMITSTGLLVLLGAVLLPLDDLLGERAGGVVASLQTERLNARDSELEERSYYESLLETDLPTWQQRLATRESAQQGGPVWEWPIVQLTGDALHHELRPSFENYGRMHSITNQWGMRDLPYDMQKPQGTFRIALLGGSIELGTGVDQQDVFEAVLEERLNRDHAGAVHSRYEILNFAVPWYGILQEVLVTERKVFDFQPDILLLTSHPGEFGISIDIIVRLIRTGVELPPSVQELMDQAAIRPTMEAREIRRRLLREPLPEDLRDWGYRRIVELSNARGVVPVWVYLPARQTFMQNTRNATFQQASAAARDAGFIALDGSTAFEGHSWEDLRVSRTDPHPNALGHRLMAERIYEEFLRYDQQLGLGLAGATTSR